MKLEQKGVALLPIDLQQGFYDPLWGNRNNPKLEQRVTRLYDAWRRSGRPIFHVQHHSQKEGSPLSPGTPGVEFMECSKPLEGEVVIEKNVHSAFIGTKLEGTLKEFGIQTLVLLGICTDHCVSTTARMAGNLGYETYVVADASATFDRTGIDGKTYEAELIHQTALASLHEQFATVVQLSDVLDSL